MKAYLLIALTTMNVVTCSQEYTPDYRIMPAATLQTEG